MNDSLKQTAQSYHWSAGKKPWSAEEFVEMVRHMSVIAPTVVLSRVDNVLTITGDEKGIKQFRDELKRMGTRMRDWDSGEDVDILEQAKT